MWTEGKEFAHTNGRIFKVFVVPMHSHQHTLAGAFVRENVKYNTHTRRQTNVDTNQQHKQTTTKNTKNCDSNCYTISHHQLKKTTSASATCAILIDFCVELVMLYVAIVCFGGCLASSATIILAIYTLHRP